MRSADDHHRGQPGGIDPVVAGGEPVQAGVFPAPNPVLDTARAVPGIKVRELTYGCVGRERGVSPPVCFFQERELRAGVRPFPSDDHPGAGRVVGERSGGEQAGDLRDVRAPHSARRRHRSPLSTSVSGCRDRGAFPWGDRLTDRETAGHTVFAAVADVGEERLRVHVTSPTLSNLVDGTPQVEIAPADREGWPWPAVACAFKQQLAAEPAPPRPVCFGALYCVRIGL